MTHLVGQTIGQYQIVEHLGRGGMADVYKAFHPGLEVYRAFKVIRPEFVAENLLEAVRWIISRIGEGDAQRGD